MSSVATVAIHASQFPAAIRRDLIHSLRARQVNHKFHYDSVKQTQKWLALHQAFSPSRTDTDCADTYDRSFAAAAKQIEGNEIHLIGLGCGGGQKDARLLKLLRRKGRKILYTPSDVSTAMVLVAREAALGVIAEEDCRPFVCDLASAEDLPEVLASRPQGEVPRLYTFFGMIPNFEPEVILPRLASLIRPQDHLLFSANLAPGADYLAGIKKILPLYDNQLTRDWLMTFLLDLGVEAGDGELRFVIEGEPASEGVASRVVHVPQSKRSAQRAAFMRVNGKILARKVRVINAEGKDVGILSINDAMNLARQNGVDLVEIDPTSLPPLCQLIDFGKFRYEQAKKEKETGSKIRSPQIQTGQETPLKRIAAYFYFQRARKIGVEDEMFEFAAGDSIRLFFSYRHTPDRVRTLLAKHGLEVWDQWITRSEEEGVFLCRKIVRG